MVFYKIVVNKVPVSLFPYSTILCQRILKGIVFINKAIDISGGSYLTAFRYLFLQFSACCIIGISYSSFAAYGYYLWQV
jgi:hypothetical protein